MAAAFVPCPNIAEFVIRQLLFGQEVNNVIHIKNNLGWAAGSIDSAATAIINAWLATFAAGQSNDLLLVNVTGKDLTTSMGVTIDKPFPPGSSGGLNVPSLPGNVAACLGLKTGLAGRSARGRMYLGGITTGSRTGDTLEPGFITNLLAHANSFKSAMETAVLHWGVLSRYSGYSQDPPKYKKVPTPRGEGVFNAITTFAVDQSIDSMRRRLLGRGV